MQLEQIGPLIEQGGQEHDGLPEPESLESDWDMAEELFNDLAWRIAFLGQKTCDNAEVTKHEIFKSSQIQVELKLIERLDEENEEGIDTYYEIQATWRPDYTGRGEEYDESKLVAFCFSEKDLNSEKKLKHLHLIRESVEMVEEGDGKIGRELIPFTPNAKLPEVPISTGEEGDEHEVVFKIEPERARGRIAIGKLSADLGFGLPVQEWAGFPLSVLQIRTDKSILRPQGELTELEDHLTRLEAIKLTQLIAYLEASFEEKSQNEFVNTEVSRRPRNVLFGVLSVAAVVSSVSAAVIWGRRRGN